MNKVLVTKEQYVILTLILLKMASISKCSTNLQVMYLNNPVSISPVSVRSGACSRTLHSWLHAVCLLKSECIKNNAKNERTLVDVVNLTLKK